MADLIKMLLTDLGLYGAAPQTFPDLVIWVTTVVAALGIVVGVIKTCFIVCREIGAGLGAK